MPVGKNKTRLAVTLESITAQCVEELAEIEKRSVSAMLAILITEALESRKITQHSFVRGAKYYKNVMGRSHTEEEKMVKEYTKHIKGQLITSSTDDIVVEGHEGKWYVINETTHKGRNVFLLEHESYGDDVAHIAVDANGSIICEEIYDDFPACLDY